ncbi:hypothetical protein PV328_003588 [Microctonus aethiopoides]|uniref:Odorant receptor n=1 Tax=Microctonus aethiopoides TaxID=144406 RepID=A0AA39F8Y7_9HYME|nr:hypothetical protein PV328_003588 [Microctonus aethiopoides]
MIAISNELWNSDTSFELLIYKIILWPLGIWPLNRGEIFSEIRLAATCICLDIEMWKNCHGFEDKLDIFVLSIFALLACEKGLLVRYHQDKIYSNVVSAVEDWNKLSIKDNLKNRKIMMQHARISRIVCISLMGPASGGTLSWIILALPLPIFKMENNTDIIRNYPLRTACIFDSATTSTIYYVIFILQIYQLVATCLGNCGNDVFFFGLSMHLCGQLEILKSEFRTLVSEKAIEKNQKRYGGDYLTSQNEELAFAAYESMWYKCPLKTMKNIAFIISRASKPINITAGKFVQMTLPTFMDILKLAVSYMSVLPDPEIINSGMQLIYKKGLKETFSSYEFYAEAIASGFFDTLIILHKLFPDSKREGMFKLPTLAQNFLSYNATEQFYEAIYNETNGKSYHGHKKVARIKIC